MSGCCRGPCKPAPRLDWRDALALVLIGSGIMAALVLAFGCGP